MENVLNANDRRVKSKRRLILRSLGLRSRACPQGLFPGRISAKLVERMNQKVAYAAHKVESPVSQPALLLLLAIFEHFLQGDSRSIQ
jgi:hypothetical protein